MDWDSDLSSNEGEQSSSPKSLNLSKFLDDPHWPAVTVIALDAELNDVSESNTQDLLSCGPDLLYSLRTRQLEPEDLRSQLPLGRSWRRLYTDAVLLQVLVVLGTRARDKASQTPAKAEGVDTKDFALWEKKIGHLDLAIILAGAPGEGRLELVHSCINYIQHNHLPLRSLHPMSPTSQSSKHSTLELLQLSQPIPTIKSPPSFATFPSLARHAFVMPSFAQDWPAIERWRSKAYLLACSGQGRVVPVERGGDYRDEGWGVDVMPWDSFLDRISWGGEHTQDANDPEKLYLAQHSLFTQFPKLRADILVPDYVYTTPESSLAYSGPPGNNEQLVINAWCGGQGANSPAHTDPYYNIYVQVIGYKHIWLAPPDATPGMYAFDGTNHSSSGDTKSERDPKREGMLGNTSSVDVFTLSSFHSCFDKYPLFQAHAFPLASNTLLGPGDALVIPAGWWHAMRGVGGESFSVSFWF